MKLEVRDLDDGGFALVWAGRVRGTLRWFDAPAGAIDEAGWWLEVPGREPQVMMSAGGVDGGAHTARFATQQTAIVLAQARVGELVMAARPVRPAGARRRRGRLS